MGAMTDTRKWPGRRRSPLTGIRAVPLRRARRAALVLDVDNKVLRSELVGEIGDEKEKEIMEI